jgi:hypothetical protein
VLPGNWDDRRAVQTLALSTEGGVLLGDQGYSGKETFDWPCGQAQTLRVMPSDEEREGLSVISQVRQRIESSFSELWHRFADRVCSRLWTGAVDKLVGKNPRLQHGAGWNHRNRLTRPATEVV